MIETLGLGFAVGFAWGWWERLGRHLSALRRAELLSRLATEATAIVLASAPAETTGGEILEAVVQRLVSIRSLPTRNHAAIERAAAAAILAARRPS